MKTCTGLCVESSQNLFLVNAWCWGRNFLICCHTPALVSVASVSPFCSLIPLLCLSASPPLYFPHLSIDLLQFLPSSHASWDISASVMLLFAHTGKPALRPITVLDNARHKSSIGPADTWGLTLEETRSPLFSSQRCIGSLLPLFHFSLFRIWFRES